MELTEKFKKGVAGPVQLREKLKTSKQKWIVTQVEHEYIEPTLLDLEGTPYELAYLLDGQIWARMILKKKEATKCEATKKASSV